MDHSISDEALKLLSGELVPNSQAYHNRLGSHDKVDDDDRFVWGEHEEEQDCLNREWLKKRDQYHTMGYRKGIIAGKEASEREGLNEKFKESVFVGYRWGLARGLTSAFSGLSDGLRKKMVEPQEDRSHFKSLYESVSSLLTTDTLKKKLRDILQWRITCLILWVTF